ncbi:hypothetical protein DITRI_Ditri15bG0017400 [Diplodiscus trichospermus]
MTHAFLEDVETRQVHNIVIQVWLKQLRKIALKADDVLDELAYEDLQRKVETQMRKKASNFFSISKNPIVFGFKMPQIVRGINISLNEINDRALKFGLQQRGHTLPPVLGGSQVTHFFGDSSLVVGREADVSKIIDLLTSSSTQQTFSIVSVVELQDIGRDFARKCGGMPLVANVIGGTMSNKWDIAEWVSLRDSSSWCSLERNEGIGFSIRTDQLIELWMPEGFLQHAEGNSQFTFEDIGSEFFDGLLSNSLLQDVEKDFYGSISSCKMHDLGHDLARSISNSKTSNTSHIQLQNVFDGMKWWRCLFLMSSLVDFKGLRVLNFCDADISCLSESLGSLKHLRYFDISNTHIRRLPKSIAQLYHLQTFRLLGYWPLGDLPKGMKNLVSLRHLYISHLCHVPHEIGCLTNLRTLPIFDVDIKSGIGEL